MTKNLALSLVTLLALALLFSAVADLLHGQSKPVPNPLPKGMQWGVAGSTGPTGATGPTGSGEIPFILCAGPCVANETTYFKLPFRSARNVTGCIIDAVEYPTGSALTVDVLKNGTTSIFSSTVLTLASGSSSWSEQTGMSAAAVLAKGDYLLPKVLTIGSTIPGQYVTVVCTVETVE
jgi:hypothetical protein